MKPDDDKTQAMWVIAADTVVDHYRIIRKIGGGGMGDLYLAEDTDLNRPVAMKFLAQHLCASADCRARFKREAQAVAILDHPNIVLPYDVGEYRERPYFAMQYVEGQSLRDLIKAQNISVERAIDIAIQICDGLRAAHEHGITHRDVKPANILVDLDNRVRIVDFGLASVAGADAVTRTGSIMGTVGYMSPEQLRGETADLRSDLFSVGVVVYELLTGRNPFAADNEAALQLRLLERDPEPLSSLRPGIPSGLQTIVKRALAKNPAARYQSSAEMLADLRQLQRNPSDSQPVRPAVLDLARSDRLRSRFAISVVILTAAVLTYLQFNRSIPESTTSEQVYLAVIPFTNLTSQSTSQAFCDGLMETLSSKLTQLAEFEGSLYVVPASEIRERRITSAAQARSTFGVNLAVTGSIQEIGDGIRTTLNLVDAASARQLRSIVRDEQKRDLLALQDSTVAELALMLNIQLRPESRGVLAAGETRSSEAYRAYLEGRGYLKGGAGLAELDSAEESFKKAIAADSVYALAYAGLGEVYARRYDLTNDVSWVDPGISFSSRALELDDQLAPVFVTLGWVHRYTGQYQEAVSYFKRALQIDSTDNEAYVQLASTYEALGRLVEAESTYQASLRRRPNYWRDHYNLARFYAFHGRRQEALAAVATAESLAPPGTFPREAIGSLYTFLGEYDQATRLLRQAIEIEPHHFAYSNLGVILQIQEEYEQAADMYRHALQLNDKDFQVWFNLATVCEAIPDRATETRQAYESAIALGAENLKVNPYEPELNCNLADCYWQVGQRDTALALARRAIKLAPNDIEVMVRAGVVLAKAGLHEESLALIIAAVERGFPVDRVKSTTALQPLLADARLERLLRPNK